MSNAEDFWMISVPGEKTPQESWEKLYKTIQPIANTFKLNIPGLKVYILEQRWHLCYFDGSNYLFFLYRLVLLISFLVSRTNSANWILMLNRNITLMFYSILFFLSHLNNLKYRFYNKIRFYFVL